MSHEHEFERAYWVRLFGRPFRMRSSWIVKLSPPVIDNESYRWMCSCGEEGVLMREAT